mmetsp:Transcript_46549/g.137549  ORF Transcript_46549/g.137549 Transcript_46549/m.137549 type:complete len:220 (-) Transcript_46549:185-844(-)
MTLEAEDLPFFFFFFFFLSFFFFFFFADGLLDDREEELLRALGLALLLLSDFCSAASSPTAFGFKMLCLMALEPAWGDQARFRSGMFGRAPARGPPAIIGPPIIGPLPPIIIGAPAAGTHPLPAMKMPPFPGMTGRPAMPCGPIGMPFPGMPMCAWLPATGGWYGSRPFRKSVLLPTGRRFLACGFPSGARTSSKLMAVPARSEVLNSTARLSRANQMS